MIIAITGATGFIGYKLLSYLLVNGFTVRVLTRNRRSLFANSSNIQIFDLDLLKASDEDLAEFLDGVSVLYHCAGQITNESLMRDLHVTATRRLAFAAVGRIKRWVQLSSVGVYGSINNGPIDESRLFSPVGEYEVTKAESELIVAKIAYSSNFEFVVLRPSNVFGISMTNRSLFSLIATIKKGVFFKIGKPGAILSYIHVDNVVEALILCGSHDAAAGQAYNLSDHRTVESFVNLICKLLDKPEIKLRLPEFFVRFLVRFLSMLPRFPLTIMRVDALTNRSYYSCKKISVELGYRHIVSMEDGLKEMIEFLKINHAQNK